MQHQIALGKVVSEASQDTATALKLQGFFRVISSSVWVSPTYR